MNKNLAILLILSVLSTPCIVLANSDNSNMPDENQNDEADREIQSEVSSDGTSVEVQSESSSNSLHFEITTKGGNGDSDGLELSTEFESDGQNIDSQSRVLFQYLQEFNDLNNDNIIQDNEKIGSPYVIGSNGFSDIVESQDSTTQVYTWTVSELSPGFLTFRGHLSPSVQTDTGYTPNAVKFDIDINGWVYQDPSYKLALLVEMRTDGPISASCDSIKQDANSKSPQAALTWTNVFTNSGSQGTIGCSTLTATALDSEGVSTDDDPNYENEQYSGIYFSFSIANAQGIQWDPEFGVYNMKNSAISSFAPNTVFAMIIALITITITFTIG